MGLQIINKQEAVVAPSCCIFLLLLLALLVPAFSYSVSCLDSNNGGYSQSSETYNHGDNDTYLLTMESGALHTFTRSELVNRSDSDAQAMMDMCIDDTRPPEFITSFDNDRQVHVDASFNVSFTMSLYEPSWKETKNTSGRGISFLVLPYPDRYVNKTLSKQLGVFTISKATPLSTTSITGGGKATGEIGWLHDGIPQLSPRVDMGKGNPHDGHLLAVHLTAIEPARAGSKYTVWVEYDSPNQLLSVYVAAGEGKGGRPENYVFSKAHVTYGHPKYQDACFGILSSVGQLLQVHRWDTQVECLPVSWRPQRAGDPIIILQERRWWRRRVAIFSALGSASAAAVTAVAVACYFNSKQRRWKKEQEKLAKAMQRLPGVPTQVHFADIRKATANFHHTMKLGTGGFSSVYRCRLPVPVPTAVASSETTAAADQELQSRRRRTSTTITMEVAVKKFTREVEVEQQRFEDFLAEVSIINRLRHKNVVPLVGWSYNKGEPLLIYTYMTNGSLDQHLFQRGGSSNGEQQPQEEAEEAAGGTSIRQWHTRYSIVRDVATGLHYVHHEHEPMVLHRDIKASNIMLDSSFRARLGDFGIACTVAPDRSSVTGVAGTWGYIAPDYAMSGRATRQTDIYAFGVLVLEVVTGRKNRDVPPDDGHISDWVWRLHGEGKLMEAVDPGDHRPQLQAVDEEEARRLLLLGLACTNPNPSSRPSMAEAVQVVTKVAPPPDVPHERPAFVWPPEDWQRSSLDGSGYSTTESSNLLVGGISARALSVDLAQPLTTPATAAGRQHGAQRTTFSV